MEATHSALNASIYKLSNVRLHSKIALWILKYYGPNWSLCHDIENYVATKCLVFIVGFCRSMQLSVSSSSLRFFLDSVATDLDNVVT